jgi:hypothetical protein
LSRSDNQRLPRVAMSDNHELTRPPLLILIDAPFSSRLSGHICLEIREKVQC